MIGRLAALMLVAPFLPQVALAEQARIALFQAVARAEPRADAAALETFFEGTPVSVFEEAQAGWRRVRLSDGNLGWMEERALRFGEAPSPTAVAPPPPAPPPDLRPRIYVKDLDHLSELVKDDPVAGPKAAKLTERRTAAWVVGGVGLAVSTVSFIYGVSEFDKHGNLDDPNFGSTGNAQAAFAVGAVTLLATGIAAVAIAPKGGDLLDVINGWNVGHPDQQFTLGAHSIER